MSAKWKRTLGCSVRKSWTAIEINTDTIAEAVVNLLEFGSPPTILLPKLGDIKATKLGSTRIKEYIEGRLALAPLYLLWAFVFEG